MNSGTAVKALRRSSRNARSIVNNQTSILNLESKSVTYTISNSAVEFTFGPGETTKELTMFVPILNQTQAKRRIFQGRMEYQVVLNHNKTSTLPIRVEAIAFGANTIDTGSFNLFSAPISGVQEYNESCPATWNVSANGIGSTITIRATILNAPDASNVLSLTVRAFLRGLYITVG